MSPPRNRQMPLRLITCTRPSADNIGVTQGAWGLIRAYRGRAPKLVSLPANPPAANPVNQQEIQDLLTNAGNKRTVRKYHVVADRLTESPGRQCKRAGLQQSLRQSRQRSQRDHLCPVDGLET